MDLNGHLEMREAGRPQDYPTGIGMVPIVFLFAKNSVSRFTYYTNSWLIIGQEIILYSGYKIRKEG